MDKSIKILADLDGKILNIYQAPKDFFLEKINNKRIFNLIESDYVVSFINDFNTFLTSLNTRVKLTYYIYNNDKLANIYIKKFNDKLLIKIRQLDFSNYTPKKNKLFDTIMFVVRFKFVIGSILPFVFATFWSLLKYKNISLLFLLLVLISLILFHIAANTFNDYFDWNSGRDIKNIDYLLTSTGGSRAIDFKIISKKTMLLISWFCVFIVFLIGMYITCSIGYKIFILGFLAFLCIYFYSAPPIHLASRYGLGELVHIFCLGPMINYGVCLSLTGNADVIDFIIGLPFGILITACLLMNEYPDSKYDKISKKYNLAVVLTDKYIPYLFLFLVLSVYLLIIFLINFHIINKIFYITLITIPYAINVIYSTFLIKKARKFIIASCVKSFYLYFFFSIMLIVSVIILNNPW